MIKDADEYLVTKILSPTYRVDGSPRTPMGALILKFIKPYLRGGWITKDTNECLGLKNIKNPTYRVDKSPWTPTGSLVQKLFCQFLPTRWMDHQDTDGVLVTDVHESYLRGGWTSKNTHRYAIT